jgi:pantoate kinase
LRAKAFCPSHITGFFEIHDESDDPLRRGSRGAGISIKLGVTTEVTIEESTSVKVKTTINDKVISAPVTRSVVGHMLGLKRDAGKWLIEVRHNCEVPVGCGLGSSGAGAWGTALALNHLLKLSLTYDRVGQIAHQAEIENRTGLGTVLGQQRGGIEIRTESGAPGIGHVDQVPFNPDLRVVFSSTGPISTKSMLSNPKIRARINEFGGQLVNQFASNASPREFMLLSRRFSEQTQLPSKNLQAGLKLLDEHGFASSSMAMFGETIFSLVWVDQTEDIMRVLKKWNNKGGTFSAEIDSMGARLVECARDD